MKLHNYCVADFETGGLSKDGCHALNHPITSAAFLGLSGLTLSEIARYESLVKGKTAKDFKGDKDVVSGYIGYSTAHTLVYQQQALKATGITIEKLEEEGIDALQFVKNSIDFFEQCKSGSNFHKLILVYHNGGYDNPFLCYLFKLFKKDLSKYFEGYKNHEGTFTPFFIDTQYLARAKSMDENQKNNLSAVTQREGIELHDAHSAMSDVVATSEILRKYILSLRNSSSSSNNIKQQSERFRDNFQFEY